MDLYRGSLELKKLPKNDPALIDEVDSFRSQLPPDQQEDYDEQLAALREDDRIRFVEHEGAEADLATREFALRGILTSSFGNPEDLNRALETAAHTDRNPEALLRGTIENGENLFTHDPSL